jgi:hypothetical protein
MANGNLGSYAVTLPNVFQAPGQALQSATEQVQRQGENLAQMQMRKQEAAERRAEKEEAKKYRDMKMVADYGDLSKFQTASDFANAVGAAKVADVKKKYFDQVKNGNLDLSEMDRDFSAITQGMAGLKTEQLLFEQLAKQKQELIPGFDVSKFLLDARKDSVARRIKDGTDFINPLEVKSSDILIKSDDPEFISQYVSGGKALTEAIQAPKGMEKSAVFSGTPMENVRFEAQIPFWKKSSFVPEQAPGGFLPKGVTPKLEIKSSVLPAESIKDSEKAPFRVVDEDVFNVFAQNPATNVELIQATRQQYPSYDTFNQVEKQYAKRKVLYDKLADIDKSDFYATASTRAPITNINIPKEPTATVNVYPEIEKLVDSRKEGMAAPLNQLSSTTQGIILDFARKAKGDNQLSQSEIAIKRNEKGEISIYDFDTETNKIGTMIAPVSKLDVNLEAQPTAKAKQEIIKGEQSKTYKYQGKTYTEQQLINAAKQSGMTLEEYKKALKL